MSSSQISILKTFFAFDADAALIAREAHDKETIPLGAQLANDARKHTLQEYINLTS